MNIFSVQKLQKNKKKKKNNSVTENSQKIMNMDIYEN